MVAGVLLDDVQTINLKGKVESLKDAIEIEHGCRAEHVDSKFVIEGNRNIWEGVVEVFDLVGCERARRCFAWRRKSGPGFYPVLILESPPVFSAHTAVRAYLARQTE